MVGQFRGALRNPAAGDPHEPTLHDISTLSAVHGAVQD